MAETDVLPDVTEAKDVEMTAPDDDMPSSEEPSYNPDRQAAVREFLDFTEYLPSDIARSLNILRRMDETFENAKKQLEEHTLAVANASNTSSPSNIPHSNGLPTMSNGLCAPTPDSPAVPSSKIMLPCDRQMALRLSIAQSLKRCRMSRMQSRVESERLSLNINRHLSRASHIVEKIKQIEIPDELPEDQIMRESPKKKVVIRLGNTWTTPQGSPQKKRPTIRLSNGRSRDEEGTSEKKKRRASNVGPRLPPPPPPTLPNGEPLPDSEKPWNQLMPHELAKLRKRMKKNAAWTPSITMIHKELENLGRGIKFREAYRHQWDGKKVEFIPAEEGGIGMAAIQAVRQPDQQKPRNKGHILAQLKKKKKERERAEADKAARGEGGEGQERRRSTTIRILPDDSDEDEDEDVEMRDVDSLPPITPADAEPPVPLKPILKRRKSSSTKLSLPKIPSLQPPVEMAIESEAETERDTPMQDVAPAVDPMEIDSAAPTTQPQAPPTRTRKTPPPILPDESIEDIRPEKPSESKLATSTSPEQKEKKLPEAKEKEKKAAPTPRRKAAPEDKDKKTAEEKKKPSEAATKKKSPEKKKPGEDKDKKKAAEDKDKETPSEKKDDSRPVFPPILPDRRAAFEPILPPPDDEIRTTSTKKTTPALKSPAKEKSGPILKADAPPSRPQNSKVVINTPKHARSGSQKKKESPAQVEKTKDLKEPKERTGKAAKENIESKDVTESKELKELERVKEAKASRPAKEPRTPKAPKQAEQSKKGKELAKEAVQAEKEKAVEVPSPTEDAVEETALAGPAITPPEVTPPELANIPKEPTPAPRREPTPAEEPEPEAPTPPPVSEPELTPESESHDGPSLQLEMEVEKETALAEPVSEATPLTESSLKSVSEEPKPSPAVLSPPSEDSSSMDDEELTPPPELEPDDVELALAVESGKAAAATKARAKPRRKAVSARTKRSRRAAAAKKADEEEGPEAEEEMAPKEATPAPKQPSPPPDIPFDLLPRRTPARAARAAQQAAAQAAQEQAASPPPPVPEPTPAPTRGTKRKRDPTPKEPTPPPPPAPASSKKVKRKGPRWSKKRRAPRPSELAAAGAEEEVHEEEEAGDDEDIFCLCRDVSNGTMVACDNPNCEKEWFHLECVGLKVPPRASVKWYCPECVVLREEGSRKRRKR